MSQQPSVPMPKGVKSGGPPPAPVDQQPEEMIDEEAGSGLPTWLEDAMPWMVSITFHLGIGLVIFFLAVVLFGSKPKTDEREQIVIPAAFEDPSLADKEGGVKHPGEGDPNRDAAQDKVKDVLQTTGFAQNESKDNSASLLEGQTADNQADAIYNGTGGSVGKGAGGSGAGNSGVLAPYGTPGGGDGAGPKSNLFGNGGRGKKIVYILDHSGSMLDNFDFLRQEAIKSVNNMIPVQQFSVVMVSEQAEVIFPALKRATPETKKEFGTEIQKFRAQGQNDDLLQPFQEAFEKAFAMKPDLIYFLTDGHFDPKLTAVVAKLNHDQKVHVMTLAFINKEASYEEQLKDMAKSNGGTYKFVSERDLGK